MLFQLQPFSPLVTATVNLLQQLQVKRITPNTVNEILQNHPDYPSLLSINDSLQQWHIDTAAFMAEPEKLHELPTPFIAVLNNKDFVTVIQNSETITYKNGTNKKAITKTKEDFIKEWKGIVLLATATEQSGDANYTKEKQKELLQAAKLPLVLLLLAGIGLFAMYKSGWHIGFSLLLLIKLAGIAVASLLLWYEIDKTNPLLKQICSATKTTNCSAILESKQSKLLGLLSWSEIGFIYFANGFLFLLFAAATKNIQPALSLIAWLNVLALPYTVFSVYYQWQVAKQWCVLCLAVQGLLVAEFITSYFFNLLSKVYIPHIPFALLVITFSLPAIAWFLLKPVLLQAQQQKRTKRQLARLKYDARIFNTLLPKQKQIATNANGLGITIGNPTAIHTIIKVCNPYCNPCAKIHPKIDALLENNPNIKVQIIFTATDKEEDKRALPVKHLLAIDAKGDKALTAKALDDWYMAEKKDYELFAAKYPMNGELKQQNEKVKAMSDWCNKTYIEFTPTFFISLPSPLGEGQGVRFYQLPDIYSVDDVNYFLTE